MISQAEIDQRINQILNGPMPPMQASVCDEDTFLGLGQEESIRVCRGYKADFDDVVHFWIKARQKREWWDGWGDGSGYGDEYESYAEYAAEIVRSEEPMKYTYISREDFYRFLNKYGNGKSYTPLSDILGLDSISEYYIAGVLTKIAWNSQATLAEFTHEYVAIHWYCTA